MCTDIRVAVPPVIGSTWQHIRTMIVSGLRIFWLHIASHTDPISVVCGHRHFTMLELAFVFAICITACNVQVRRLCSLPLKQPWLSQW